MIDAEKFGKTLNKLRGKKGLREISKEIGLSVSTLSRTENGKMPTADNFFILLNWMGRKADDFLINPKKPKLKKLLPSDELMIGNFVEPDWSEASGYIMLTAQILLEQDEAFKSKRAYLQPIELTEWWLSHFNFQRSYNKEDGNYEWELEGLILSEYEFSDKSENGFYLTLNITDFKVKYVHQLQNLYHSLFHEHLY